MSSSRRRSVWAPQMVSSTQGEDTDLDQVPDYMDEDSDNDEEPDATDGDPLDPCAPDS